MKTVKERAEWWIKYGGKGSSSETLWNALMDYEVYYHNYPHDSGDFGRCYGLLLLIPEWKEKLSTIGDSLGWEWENIINEWDYLCGLYEDLDNTGNHIYFNDELSRLVEIRFNEEI